MSIHATERAQAIQRAEEALGNLHDHQATSRNQLGAARDQLNLVYSLTSTREMWGSVYALECIVLEVYGTNPPDQPSAP